MRTEQGKLWFYWLLAVGLGAIADGRWLVPLAAWLAPLFLLRVTRAVSPAKAYGVAALGLLIAGMGTTWGVMPLPPVEQTVTVAVGAVMGALIYLADRWAVPRLGGLLATLPYPAMLVAFEYLNTQTNPFGSWGSMAYTQHADLPFIQLAAITGIWGLTFVMAWVASLAQQAWLRGWGDTLGRQALITGLSLLAIVHLGGAARLWLAPEAQRMSVASLSESTRLPNGTDVLMLALTASQSVPGQRAEALTEGMRINDRLLARSEAAARQGAKVVLWSEGNALVERQSAAALVTRGQELARRHGVYLGMAMLTVDARGREKALNQLVLVGPQGDVRWTYTKAKLVPGMEAAHLAAGDGELPFSRDELGTFTGAICFDTDFPAQIRPAGGAALLLSPARDWAGIDPAHTRQAAFRAVEGGFGMLRQAYEGRSAIIDPYGRFLEEQDHFRTHEPLLRGEARLGPVPTLYPLVGDLFAWACLLLLAALLVLSALARSTATRSASTLPPMRGSNVQGPAPTAPGD